MRKVTTLFIFLTLHLLTSAQGGVWTWVKGDNYTSSQGVRGQVGIANSTDYPSGRYNAAQWTDLDGNFWIFGGQLNTNPDMCNDLWKFEPANNTWTWVKGPSAWDEQGTYGTQGVPASANVPGARCKGARTWTDLQGRLWLSAGYGYDANGNVGWLDDVWMYDITTNQWTWMKGTNTGNDIYAVYGTLGMESPDNTPGGRKECNSNWVLPDGTFWTFGGDDFNIGPYNDMWRFNINTNNWAWMGGGFINTQYGTLNVESSFYLPTSRRTFTHWQDSANNLYIFGGFDDYDNGTFNDIWRFNTTNNEWTWIGGEDTENGSGTYVSQCKNDQTLLPGSRFENRTVQTKGCIDISWSFGGLTNLHDNVLDSYNDLWIYNIVTTEWLWVSGSNEQNPAGNFGIINQPSIANIPPGRGGCCLWVDQSGSLWMWGGADSLGSTWNDMWNFVPDSNCMKNLCIPTDNNVFVIATAFSPNGDNKNELFYPILSNSFNSSILSFKIYNRWGQLIYENPLQGWDGTYKGEPQPAGIYTCFVTVSLPDNGNSEITRQGTFALFR